MQREGLRFSSPTTLDDVLASMDDGDGDGDGPAGQAGAALMGSEEGAAGGGGDGGGGWQHGAAAGSGRAGRVLGGPYRSGTAAAPQSDGLMGNGEEMGMLGGTQMGRQLGTQADTQAAGRGGSGSAGGSGEVVVERLSEMHLQG